MKIRKRLIALVMMAVMVFGLLPMNIQAAQAESLNAYWFSIKKGDVRCTQYDLDGDGKKDIVEYKKLSSKRYQLLVKGKAKTVSNISKANYVGLFNVKNDRIYLIVSEKTSGGMVYTKAYLYRGGKFSVIMSRNITNYGKVKFASLYPIGVKGDLLYMCTAPSEKKKNKLLSSFQKAQEDVGMVVPFRFRNGTISIASREAEPYATTTLKFRSNGFFTSTTENLTDSDGLVVRPNREFTVEKFYIGQKDIRCQVSINGEKGWFNCSNNNILLRDGN